MKCTSSSTAPAAACGLRPTSRIRWSGTIPDARAWAISAPSACAMAASSFDGKASASTHRRAGTSSSNSAGPAREPDAGWLSSRTTPGITMPGCIDPGVMLGLIALHLISCRRTARTSTRSNASGSSFGVCVFTTAISQASTRSSKPSRISSRNGNSATIRYVDYAQSLRALCIVFCLELKLTCVRSGANDIKRSIYAKLREQNRWRYSVGVIFRVFSNARRKLRPFPNPVVTAICSIASVLCSRCCLAASRSPSE